MLNIYKPRQIKWIENSVMNWGSGIANFKMKDLEYVRVCAIKTSNELN